LCASVSVSVPACTSTIAPALSPTRRCSRASGRVALRRRMLHPRRRRHLRVRHYRPTTSRTRPVDCANGPLESDGEDGSGARGKNSGGATTRGKADRRHPRALRTPHLGVECRMEGGWPEACVGRSCGVSSDSVECVCAQVATPSLEVEVGQGDAA
jgi:hypothetical protein